MRAGVLERYLPFLRRGWGPDSSECSLGSPGSTAHVRMNEHEHATGRAVNGLTNLEQEHLTDLPMSISMSISLGRTVEGSVARKRRASSRAVGRVEKAVVGNPLCCCCCCLRKEEKECSNTMLPREGVLSILLGVGTVGAEQNRAEQSRSSPLLLCMSIHLHASSAVWWLMKENVSRKRRRGARF